jgi:Tetratricopeptide repeat
VPSQSIRGDQGVQIAGAYGSTFNITYNNGTTRAVPLERATVPAPADARSPALLMRARSGVVPFTARQGLRTTLLEWLDADAPFAGAVIGGAGGAGKTRLAVEICDRAEGAGWLSGFLAHIDDFGSLEALAEAPMPRLVAVDYAESRAAQLKVLLPLLASRATSEAPVRVLLLVRAGPKRTTDWAESLRNQSDLLDSLLDRCETHALEELPSEANEREELFEAAASAFAERNGTPVPTAPAALQDSSAFVSPLLIVLAAYLTVHGDEAPPRTREELLRAVLRHEERYWRSSSGDLFNDEDQPRKVIALTTLVSADSEGEAVDRLRLLPDFVDAPAERLGLVARWAARQYPGTGWWNPLEPDLVGEQLVADSLSDQPRVLAGALAPNGPRQLLRPLELFGRASANHPRLAAALQPILGAELRRLCALAVAQSRDEMDRDLIHANVVTLAAVLEKAIGAVEIAPGDLSAAVNLMPDRSNLVLNPLALALDVKLVAHLRRLAAADPANHEPSLAMSLNNLSVRLGYAGRRPEGLAAIEECVETYRRLAAGDPAGHEHDLAMALNNLSVDLMIDGQGMRGLAASEECVAAYRRLAGGDPATYEPGLAIALNTLSNTLAAAGHRREGLAASEECVETYRRLAADDATAYEPDLAMALNTLSIRLGELGSRADGLAAVEECVELRRRLAAENPAAHQADLARALNNFSIDLAAAGRKAEALAAIEECAETYRRLAADNPAAYEPDLARALNTLSIRLGEEGRAEEGIAAVEECVEIRRRLAAENPAAYEPDLAGSLNNLSIDLGRADRGTEGLAISEECIEIYRRYAADNPAAFEPELARGLNTLSIRLSEADRHPEAIAATEEGVEIRRRLAAENPAAHEADLAGALNNLSIDLGRAGRDAEGLAASEECVEIYRRYAAEDPAAYKAELATALNSLAIRLTETGRHDEGRRAAEESLRLRTDDE